MTIQIAVRLPDEVVAALDELVASADGPPNRTVAIRAAVELYVRTARRRAVDEALRQGYTARPPGTHDRWGSLDDTTAADAAAAQRELDADDGGW